MTSASLSGPGVHSGAPARVDLSLRARDGAGPASARGIRFFFPGWDAPLLPHDLGRLPRRARRATVLGEGSARIETPEHLLASLLFFSDRDLDVACDAAELPGLDGSALPYRDALAALAPPVPGGDPARAPEPAWREYPCALSWEHAWERGFVRARPAERFSVTYELARGPLRESFRLETPAQAWREVLPARSFAFLEDWRGALSSGPDLMAGAGADSGLLLAASEAEHAEWIKDHPEWSACPFPLCNQPAWRVEGEAVKHKILDLLGDLALAGLALPALDLHVRNGGHAVNQLLLEKASAFAQKN